MIIDTGDLTDYGSSLEAELITRLTALPVPMFLYRATTIPQVIETMRQKGPLSSKSRPLRSWGCASSALPTLPQAGRSVAIASEEYLRSCGREAYRLLLNEEIEPDIVAVHNPLAGEGFSGQVPLILSGHTHRARVTLESTISINAGTTGAAGVRGLYAPGENPYSMVVLYFDRSEGERQTLVMADLLSVHQNQDSFTLQRYYNQNSLQPVTMESSHGAGRSRTKPSSRI